MGKLKLSDERHLVCPRCSRDETRRTRRFGKPLGDEQWCTVCGHRWEPGAESEPRSSPSVEVPEGELTVPLACERPECEKPRAAYCPEHLDEFRLEMFGIEPSPSAKVRECDCEDCHEPAQWCSKHLDENAEVAVRHAAAPAPEPAFNGSYAPRKDPELPRWSRFVAFTREDRDMICHRVSAHPRLVEALEKLRNATNQQSPHYRRAVAKADDLLGREP